jgi:hypothetical protein
VHRSEEREKRREKYKLERQNGGLPKDDLRALQLDRLRQAAENSIRVGIDLQFDDAMNEKVGTVFPIRCLDPEHFPQSVSCSVFLV